MAAVAFKDALDQLEALRAAEPFDAWAVRGAVYALSQSYAPGTSARLIRRMVDNCLSMLGLTGAARPVVADEGHQRSLDYALHSCLRALFVDDRADSRSFVQSGVDRTRALGPELWCGGAEVPIPLPNIPLDPEEAAILIAPYLNHLEAQLDDDPLSHIHLCWDILRCPAPPFDTVFARWLEAVDLRRGTDDLTAIRRAMALSALAQRGQQRLGWQSVETYLLPQLRDPHPLVAAAAAKFLGMLYDDPEEMINSGTPLPLPEMLDQLAFLPQHRRAVAGGFVDGLIEGSLHDMGKLAALEGFYLDAWVMAVLAEKLHEPFLPSAQSFWFHVHEGYCFAPAFVTRMIDAGHLWEAMMTATEMHCRVEGMDVVLERLVTTQEEGVSGPAQQWLDLHYKDGSRS